ncbi:SNF-related serine/threonine-protein kinase-like [Tiliqua scincoides]|uniref:SNF-related serine/threonine-protein kinase-like n=1 Tax=Tiliqua scincoides TaxID=71010 RepID=UPI003461EE69
MNLSHALFFPSFLPFFFLPPTDIWSLGVILYMLVCGQPPFQEANDSETLTMILDCRYIIPPHVSSQCADLISQMLQRNPQHRASLEQIESHPWLQGVDPSPASRCLLPLTSHKRVSEEEHDIIIQAMMCGNIADRETIQEALEADRYNHVTATYFLLAERILREKQEKQSHSPSLVYNLAQHVQSRSTFSTVSDPSCPLPPPEKSPQLLPTTKSTLEKFSEHSGKSALCFSALGEDESSGFHRCRQPIRALIRPSLIESPIAKSTPALQQISEEEEEDEEEEEEEGKPGLFRRRTSSLNQEQMRDFQSAKASFLFCRSLAAHNKMGKNPTAGFPRPRSLEQGPEMGLGLVLPQEPVCPREEHSRSQTLWQGGSRLGMQGGKMSLGPPLRKGGPEGKPVMDSSKNSNRACQEEGPNRGTEVETSQTEQPLEREEANNNNTPKMATEEELLKTKMGNSFPRPSEAATQDSCPQRVARVTAAMDPEDTSRKPGKNLETGPANRPKHLHDSHGSPGGSESLADNVIKLDPAKGKSANLKDRILQFPLCEKALAFRMRPTSKESLLSLGQFNCCHVI